MAQGGESVKRDRVGALLVFAGLCLLSLAAYLGFSEAVDAGLAKAHLFATKLVEVVL